MTPPAPSWRERLRLPVNAAVSDAAPGFPRPRGRRFAVRGLGGWWAIRPTLSAAAIYAVLALLMVSPGLAPGRALSSSDFLFSTAPWSASRPPGVRPLGGSNLELSDEVDFFQPFLQYTKQHLPDVPLWNPHIYAGQPFNGDAQSAVFSPFSVPVYLLPFWFSLAVTAALKLFVAALGTYLLARALGMRFGGALLSGVVFGFGLYMVAWLAWPPSSVWALIPWLLLLVDKVIRGPSLLSAAGLALVVGLQFLAGHPESSFHALITAGAFTLLRLVQARRKGRRALAERVGTVIAAAAIGTALAAVVLIPFAEALLHSDQAAYRGFLTSLHEQPRYLLGLMLPDFWGRPTQVLTEDFARGFTYDHVVYAGALTLMLAAAALILRPNIERLAVAAYGLFAVAMAFGLQPIFGIVSPLPGFDVAKNERMIILLLLCLALLAGWGLDELNLAAPARLRRRAMLGLNGLLVLAPLAWMTASGRISIANLSRTVGVAAGIARPPGQVVFPPLPSAIPIIRTASLLEWLVFAGVAFGLVWLRTRQRLRVAPFTACAVLLLAADLFKIGLGQNPAIPVRHASPPMTPALRYLQSHRPNRFVGLTPQTPRTFIPIPPNLSMKFGLYDARGYDYPVERHFDQFWRSNIAGLIGDIPPVLADSTPRAVHALGLLSVTDVLQAPVDPPLHRPHLRLAYSGPDARVYTNTLAIPRVVVVGQQHVVGSQAAALAAVSELSFDGRRTVITQHQVPGLPQASAGSATLAGSARLVSYGAQRVTIVATARQAAMLVLTDDDFPGWTASVDGRPVGIDRADYLFRGVPLSPGVHRIEFRYEPVSWRTGWIVSLAALFGLGAMVLLGLRRRRREAQHTGWPRPGHHGEPVRAPGAGL